MNLKDKIKRRKIKKKLRKVIIEMLNSNMKCIQRINQENKLKLMEQKRYFTKMSVESIDNSVKKSFAEAIEKFDILDWFDENDLYQLLGNSLQLKLSSCSLKNMISESILYDEEKENFFQRFLSCIMDLVYVYSAVEI